MNVGEKTAPTLPLEHKTSLFAKPAKVAQNHLQTSQNTVNGSQGTYGSERRNEDTFSDEVIKNRNIKYQIGES